jgi:hypothetical protein
LGMPGPSSAKRSLRPRRPGASRTSHSMVRRRRRSARCARARSPP